jgi:N-acetyl-anhydromuramyl-L-alanine amidase AmpD
MARRWQYLLIHHTASKPGVTAAELEAMHRARGFRGIGYHYVVYRSPQDEYRRGYLQAARPDSQSGAHAGVGTWNAIALGLSVAGDFHPGNQHSETLDPDSLLYRDILQAVVHLCRKYNIPPANIRGHRNVKATACPGDNFPLARLIADASRMRAG